MEALELDSKYCPDDYEFKSKKDKVEQTYATWKPGNCWMNRRFHPIVKIRLLYHAKYLHSMEKLSFRAHLIDGPLHKGETSNIDCCDKSEILLGEENRALFPTSWKTNSSHVYAWKLFIFRVTIRYHLLISETTTEKKKGTCWFSNFCPGIYLRNLKRFPQSLQKYASMWKKWFSIDLSGVSISLPQSGHLTKRKPNST